MSRIIIDPVTRISGFMEIQAEIDANKVTDARVMGLLYRGFSTMLKGRAPIDSIYYNERICGICSAAHAYASALALENALQISVTLNDRYLRDIIHGLEYVQNHLRHFYLLNMPSYVKIANLPIADIKEYGDFRLPEDINNVLEGHYLESIEYARLAHEAQAELGGKAPHNHGIFIGGVTVRINAYQLEKVRSIVRKITGFVTTSMMEDASVLSEYYPDYFEKGISYPNFLSYGVFDYEDPAISYVRPGIMINGEIGPLETDKISEQVKYSWITMDQNNETADTSKPEAYSFVKAPRYEGLPMEVGPLARMLISGEYHGGHSCMDRNIARVMETGKVLSILTNLIDRVELLPNNQSRFQIPDNAYGVGMIDTTRGALAHWIQIENKVISFYDIITPSAWNLSPRDDTGLVGTAEKSLIGTVLQNEAAPIEIGRIIRSFDPCVSCATNIIEKNGKSKIIEVRV